jgi:type VI protein secretion system component Hcp
MARSPRKNQKARKLNRGKKLEATRPLDKVSIGEITISKTVDTASPTILSGTTSSPSK